MQILTMPQLSKEWFSARAGVLTASAVGDIYATRKDGKESAARRDLRMRLALERLMGTPIEDPYTNADMERGRTLEAAARAAYVGRTNHAVAEVGFCLSDDGRTGASPDGLVSDVGLLEIKCPRPATHFETVKAKAVPTDYVPQVTHALFVTGRAWVDFVSYCPQMPWPVDVCIVRHYRSEREMAAHELMVRQFLAAVDATAAEVASVLAVP
jgi:hypothetical protein